VPTRTRAWAQERIRNHFASNRDGAPRLTTRPYAPAKPAPVQRKPADSGDWRQRLRGGPDQAAILQTGGTPLPAAVRAKMEPHLGADLSAVKVHADGESGQAAKQLGARAFTTGTDVHFRAGEFSPGSKEGDRLLAHELAHVVQGSRRGKQRAGCTAGHERHPGSRPSGFEPTAN
jgi:hypothetical protein